ncbi:hypothetical protein DSO57_1020118 [Entomophthora muscae]|uniref:Uncharacterized protein n=1 Tax=Entomophthora muscae TaxID=34485 RepID=A0ACC2ST23_9FUNG|nr:hypothetical protein DSO57_1020118 [Entomophthora muscae]
MEPATVPLPGGLVAFPTVVFPNQILNYHWFICNNNSQEVEDRIIAYVTTQTLEKPKTATTWLCNSTFATYQTIFKQLWVLHGQFNAQVIHLVFFLLPGAKTEVYTRTFKIVQDALSSLPTNQLPPPTHTTRANPSSAKKDESTLVK